jgi:hypothetical protein
MHIFSPSITGPKTVELIIERKPWTPTQHRYTDSTLVPVRIGFRDTVLREQAKAAKGRWNPEKKLWFILYGKIRGTALEKHIVLDAFPRE